MQRGAKRDARSSLLLFKFASWLLRLPRNLSAEEFSPLPSRFFSLVANLHTIKVRVTRRRDDLAAQCRRRRRDAGCGYEADNKFSSDAAVQLSETPASRSSAESFGRRDSQARGHSPWLGVSLVLNFVCRT